MLGEFACNFGKAALWAVAADGAGDLTLGRPPRLRNGMRSSGISVLLDDNRRLFRICCSPEMVEVRRRLFRVASGLSSDFGSSGGVFSINGLLDVGEL